MANDLQRLQLLDQYGASRRHVFPSKTSMTWFVRTHCDAWSEALLMVAGRWFAHSEKFDAFVLKAGARAAAAATNRSNMSRVPLKRILKLDGLRLRGLKGEDEFLMVATAQNLRRMAKWIASKQEMEIAVAA